MISMNACGLYISSEITSKECEEVQQEMNEYLNKKYEMQFEFVKKPYISNIKGISFGFATHENDTYEAKVIPMGKPELEFLIKRKKSKIGNYYDDYLKVNWTNEGKQDVENKIREVYGSETDFLLKYEFNFNEDEFKNLSYTEVLAKCDPPIHIRCYIFSDEKFEKYKEAEKAYKILKSYLIDNKIDLYDFDIIFYTNKYRKEYASNGNNSGNKSFDKLHEEGLLINYLVMYSLKDSHHLEINNSDDLVKYFKY